HDVVAGVRRLFGMRRVGHCGTLDPFATGVLVLCLGAYTRLSDWLGKGEKEYEAVFLLGATSDTGDRMGRIEPSPEPLPAAEAVLQALEPFRGIIQQVPPAYSAVKVDGVRSYRLARNQQAVTLAPRTVEIGEIEVLENQPPRLRVRVRCSRGTYIRALAADLGSALGCGGYVEELRRLRAGTLSAGDGYTFDQLREMAATERLDEALVPVDRALAQMRAWLLSPGEAQVFGHGGALRPAAGGLEDGEWAVYSENRLLGIGSAAAGSLRPLRVFAGQVVGVGVAGGA
ncbi:MAG: tRNA pseudouridine(55) synthase TruB, partial [Candidatus Latescibacteria bacterium]|nr:tRNA pseudouridine(55) synthase TruB [Candidatus Latescibacterota bacterium]